MNQSFPKKIFIITLIIVTAFILAFMFYINRKYRPKVLAVAFILDDWGYNLNNINLAIKIERPLTLAILPHLRYSKDIAEKVRAESKLCDVILHLPLESKSGKVPERDTIQRNMKKSEIISILDSDIKSIPGLIGVSSHQGSKATEDEKLMKIVLSEIKKRNLFFLDSRTTPVSVCPRIAKDIGLRYLERDVFLDLIEKKDSARHIKKQIKEVIKIVKVKGHAVAIGHDKKMTLEAIKDSIPELEKQGIKIVPLKELMR